MGSHLFSLYFNIDFYSIFIYSFGIAFINLLGYVGYPNEFVVVYDKYKFFLALVIAT